jgi:hypothetical protein
MRGRNAIELGSDEIALAWLIPIDREIGSGVPPPIPDDCGGKSRLEELW